MRIRTVKPEFWSDEKTGTLSMPAALLFLAMFNFADDKGRLRGVPSLLKAQAFPYRPEVDIEAALGELLAKKLVRPYQARGQAYLEITNFLKHQVINKPSKKTLLPEPETYETIEENKHSGSTTVALREPSGSVPVALSESSGSTTPRKGREGKGKDLKALSPKKPATGAQSEKPLTPGFDFKTLTNRLMVIFEEVRGQEYLHQGAKDGAALVRLSGFEPDEIARRWRRGLEEKVNPWLQVNTFAQLAQKFNDLGAPPVQQKALSSMPKHERPKVLTKEERAELLKDRPPIRIEVISSKQLEENLDGPPEEYENEGWGQS